MSTGFLVSILIVHDSPKSSLLIAFLPKAVSFLNHESLRASPSPLHTQTSFIDLYIPMLSDGLLDRARGKRSQDGGPPPSTEIEPSKKGLVCVRDIEKLLTTYQPSSLIPVPFMLYRSNPAQQ